MTSNVGHLAKWRSADENFRQQIRQLMARMGVRNLNTVADEAGIKPSTFRNRFDAPSSLLKREERMLSVLFERYGMAYDATLGEGESA